jgi:ribosomal protein S2
MLKKKEYKMLDIKKTIDHKGYIGDNYLNKDLIGFVAGISKIKGNYIFNFSKQVQALRRVFFLIKKLKLLNKPILFFGLNKKVYEDVYLPQISRINKEIYDLSFTFLCEDKKLKNLINNFYLNFYEKPNFDNLNELVISNCFREFNKVLKLKFFSKNIIINGFFFDNWEGSYFSNYNTLKSHLNFRIKKLFFELEEFNGRNSLKEKESLSNFLLKFRSFYFLSKILKKDESLPGAAVFFSKEGYEDLFLEFKRLGIPVICVVNSSDSLKGIDYPLFGNTKYFDIIIFYQKLFKKILN